MINAFLTARLRRSTFGWKNLIAFSFAGFALAPITVRAQGSVGGRNEVFAGGELESYLRYLETLGKTDPYPISIRGFSAKEIDKLAAKDSAHPWARRYDLQKTEHHGFEWTYVRPQLSAYVNSAFPYGGNDGPVWQGKGLTTALQGGVSARWGYFSGTFAPIAFRSENQSFPLMQNGECGRLQCGHRPLTTYIDLPQSPRGE